MHLKPYKNWHRLLRDAWVAKHVDVMNILVDSMPRRLLALVSDRDGHTRYQRLLIC